MYERIGYSRAPEFDFDLDHASQRGLHGVDQRITLGARVPCETELDVRQVGQGVRVVAGHRRFEVDGHQRRHAEPGPQAGEHAAFALESVQGELSYVVGPPIVILCAAKVSPGVVAWGVGAAIVAGGAGIARLNPPLRAEGEADAGPAGRPRRRDWLGPGMIAMLVMAFGITMLLSGTDLAIVATLRQADQVSWAAVVVAVYGVASITGGLVYDWRWLCVAGAGAGLCTAPALSTVADAVTRLALASVRGEATGLHSSALSAGFALGSRSWGRRSTCLYRLEASQRPGWQASSPRRLDSCSPDDREFCPQNPECLLHDCLM